MFFRTPLFETSPDARRCPLLVSFFLAYLAKWDLCESIFVQEKKFSFNFFNCYLKIAPPTGVRSAYYFLITPPIGVMECLVCFWSRLLKLCLALPITPLCLCYDCSSLRGFPFEWRVFFSRAWSPLRAELSGDGRGGPARVPPPRGT